MGKHCDYSFPLEKEYIANKERGRNGEGRKVEQTAFLRHYMKCKIAIVRSMSKICCFAIIMKVF
jgi:hypothetical protein